MCTKPVLFACVLSMVAATSIASPVTYDINFTLVNGTHQPTNGSFVYDDTLANPFSNFTVAWVSRSFDLSAAANSPTRFGACGSGDTAFGVLDHNVPCVSPNGAYMWTGAFVVGPVIEPDAHYSFAFAATDGNEINAVGFESVIVPKIVPVNPSAFADRGTFSIQARAVPAPATLTLLSSGLLALLGRRQRRKALRR